LTNTNDRLCLTQELNEILNQVAQINTRYDRSTQVVNLSNLIVIVSKYVDNSIKNNYPSNVPILYLNFCASLLKAEKCFIRTFFEHPFSRNNCNANQLIYNKLSDDYLKACDEAKEILSKIIILNCGDLNDLEEFKKDLIVRPQYDWVVYTDNWCNKIKQNINFVACHLFPNDQNLVNQLDLAASKEIEFINCHKNFSYRINTPISEVFCGAGKFVKSKIEQELARRNIETEKELALEQTASLKAQEWKISEDLKQKQILKSQTSYKSKINLPKVKSEFDKTIINSKSDYERKIAKCGLAFAKNLEKTIEGKEFVLASRNEERLKIVNELIVKTKSRIKQEKVFKLSDNTKHYLIASQEDLSSFEKFNGDKLQHRLHGEIVNTLNESSDLFAAFGNNKPIIGIDKFVHCVTDMAMTCNAAEDMELGFAYEDFGNSLVDLGKGIANYSVLAGDVTCRCAWAASKGVAKGAYNSLYFAGNTFLHPIQTTGETLEAFYLVGCLIVKSSECLYDASMLVYENPEEFMRMAEEYAIKFKNLSKQGAIYFCDHPEECIEKSSEILTTFLCGNKLPTFQGALLKNLNGFPASKGLSNCVAEEINTTKVLKEAQKKRIAKLPDLSLRSVSVPINQVFKNVFAINQIKKEHGQEVLDVVLKLVKEEPAILQGKGLQKLLKPKIPEIENLNYRRVRPKDDFYAAMTWAIEQYANIRKCVDDVDQIAKNTGFVKQNIQKIKNHIFYKKHILEEGYKLFNADLEMAAAWDRLVKGDFIKNDLQLLKHELLESIVEENYLLNYGKSHDMAKKIFEWDYPVNSL